MVLYTGFSVRAPDNVMCVMSRDRSHGQHINNKGSMHACEKMPSRMNSAEVNTHTTSPVTAVGGVTYTRFIVAAECRVRAIGQPSRSQAWSQASRPIVAGDGCVSCCVVMEGNCMYSSYDNDNDNGGHLDTTPHSLTEHSGPAHASTRARRDLDSSRTLFTLQKAVRI